MAANKPTPSAENIGKRFGCLVVLRVHIAKHSRADCICDCGKEATVLIDHLRSGSTTSCGCIRAAVSRETVKRLGWTTHGMSRLPEFKTWKKMIQRCHNPKKWNFCYYGGRGITVCDGWRSSFPAFFAYIGPRPSPKHTIDRFPNNNGNYEPGNVRWATQTQQCNNKRNNHLVTINGDEHSITEWIRLLGVAKVTVYRRITAGMSAVDALTIPARKKRKPQR